MTLDGVHGIVKISRPRSYDTRFEHHPSPKGRRSEAYRATRSRLGDDYTSDLTEAGELQAAICEALGVTFRPLTAEQLEAL